MSDEIQLSESVWERLWAGDQTPQDIYDLKAMASELLALRKIEARSLRKDKARLDELERWLTEDPTRFQIGLRRMESEAQFIVGLRPSMGTREAKNYFGPTLRAAIDAMKEGK